MWGKGKLHSLFVGNRFKHFWKNSMATSHVRMVLSHGAAVPLLVVYIKGHKTIQKTSAPQYVLHHSSQ